MPSFLLLYPFGSELLFLILVRYKLWLIKFVSSISQLQSPGEPSQPRPCTAHPEPIPSITWLLPGREDLP